MQNKEKKKILESAIVNSFIDDYKAYKRTIDFINKDLKELNINYQYTYDEFCVEFLNESLKNMDNIDIFNVEHYNQFFINFWQFNLYNLQSMLNKKLDSLDNIDKKYLN